MYCFIEKAVIKNTIKIRSITIYPIKFTKSFFDC